MQDTEPWKWSWLEPGTKKNNCTYYGRVQAARSSDKSHRVYETGHTVHVANDENQLWVAQIVEMYQVGIDLEDEECVLVMDKGIPSHEMRCTLRWFYSADDENMADSKRVCPWLPKPVKNEIYFSDHVEDGKSNNLSVIDGRVFLCSTEKEMTLFPEMLPTDYREGDAVCLCRFFYGYNSGNPPPIRELARRELEYFRSNPSRDPDLYSASKAAIFGRHGAVMKGTGKKRRYPISLFPNDEVASWSSNVRTDTATDEIQKITRHPATTPSEDIDRHSLSVSKISGNESNCSLKNDFLSNGNFHGKRVPSDDSSSECVQSDSPFKEEQISLREQEQTFQNENISPNKTEKKKQALSFCSSIQETDEEQGISDVHRTELGETQAVWMRFKETLITGTREQQIYFLQRIPELIQTLVKLMDDCDLEFNMNEESKKLLASNAIENF